MKDYEYNIGYFTEWDIGEAFDLGVMVSSLLYLCFTRGHINRIVGVAVMAIGLGLFFRS